MKFKLPVKVLWNLDCFWNLDKNDLNGLAWNTQQMWQTNVDYLLLSVFSCTWTIVEMTVLQLETIEERKSESQESLVFVIYYSILPSFLPGPLQDHPFLQRKREMSFCRFTCTSLPVMGIVFWCMELGWLRMLYACCVFIYKWNCLMKFWYNMSGILVFDMNAYFRIDSVCMHDLGICYMDALNLLFLISDIKAIRADIYQVSFVTSIYL